ncbi:hypothetical protein EYF80_015434 [Liparis tanakae]|uniref:Uncharacterized protein n=1 Tax=Liparis tanakae TaxID=230148 RepID=A0A4Z2I9D8_9TELE|nr:hypothetical protein EYF80_015434 [Liparis tanakae]
MTQPSSGKAKASAGPSSAEQPIILQRSDFVLGRASSSPKYEKGKTKVIALGSLAINNEEKHEHYSQSVDRCGQELLWYQRTVKLLLEPFEDGHVIKTEMSGSTGDKGEGQTLVILKKNVKEIKTLSQMCSKHGKGQGKKALRFNDGQERVNGGTKLRHGSGGERLRQNSRGAEAAGGMPEEASILFSSPQARVPSRDVGTTNTPAELVTIQ